MAAKSRFAVCVSLPQQGNVAGWRQIGGYSLKLQTIHFYVSGRVQGVFFRAATRDQARLFGLTGWVRNTADGRVEGMVRGEVDRLAEFRRWLHSGPETARVLNVEWQEVPDQEFDGFTIR